MKIFSKHTLTGLIAFGIISVAEPDLGGVFLISIVCTVGISLVIWIPLMNLIGYIINSIIYAIMGKSMDVKTESDQKKPNNEQKWSFTSFPDNLSMDVKKYILDAKAMNIPYDEIKNRLLANGWPEGDIDTALNSLEVSDN
jgi:hypothetical protein